MDQLPLSRDPDGQVHFEGVGPVSVKIDYHDILGNGGQGVVFGGRIIDCCHGRLVREVAIKVNKEVSDPLGQLQAEATVHAQAWANLPHVLRPLGFLLAYETTGTPAMLVLEIGLSFGVFLARAGPMCHRHLNWIKTIARITFQLLRFISSADSTHLMHKDIKMQNMFVVNAEDLESAELAVGDFGAAQWGEETDGGDICYRTGVYTWDHTSPRMASFIYDGISDQNAQQDGITLTRQLTFYNDMFGWGRITFVAFADRPPPHTLSGPRQADYALIPSEGYGDVLDAVRHLMLFALELLVVGHIDDQVTSEYVNSLEWYHELSEVLAGNANNSQ